MSRVEVVRVVSTHPPTQGAFVEINATDFDPQVHTLYRDPADQPEAFEQPARRASQGRARKSTGATDGNR